MTKQDGTVDSTISYNAWGQVTGSSGNGTDSMFTDKMQDPGTGLYYLGARFYDPEVGRFLT